MKAKKRFSRAGLIIVMGIGGILLALVGQEFLADVEEARIQEKEFKDPFEMGINSISVGNPALGIKSAKFYIMEDLSEKWWGYKFVQFKGVGDEGKILEKVDCSESKVILDPNSFDPKGGYLGEKTIYSDSPYWDQWHDRFEMILERYAEKLRRLREQEKRKLR